MVIMTLNILERAFQVKEMWGSARGTVTLHFTNQLDDYGNGSAWGGGGPLVSKCIIDKSLDY